MKKTPTIKFAWRKFFLFALVSAPLAVLPSPLWALPVTTAANLTSSAGASTLLSGTASALVITTPDRSVLTWVNFGSAGNTIAGGESINYDLPSATSAVLNVVSGTNPTAIAGTITSIGNVYILNKNGITVDTASAVISVANLGLSTADEAPFNFQNTGTLSYPNTATVPVNIIGNSTGNITATANGTVTIVGKGVNLVGTIVAGALNVNSQGGIVKLGDSVSNNAFTLGVNGDKAGNLTVTTGGGAIDVSNGSGQVQINGSTANLTTGGGAVTQGSSGLFRVGNTSVNGNLTINAGTGIVNLPAIDGNGNGINVTITAAGLSSASNTTLVTDTGDISLNNSTILGNLVISSAGKINASNVTLTNAATGISLTSGAGNAGNITYSGSGNLTFAKIKGGAAAGALTNTISLTSTSGSIVLPGATDNVPSAQNYGTLSVKATGNITQTAAINATGTVTFDSGNTVDMTSFTNTLPKLIVKNTPNGATITDSGAVVLSAGSNATGNVTITGGTTFTFGATAADAMTFNNLTLSGAGAITDLTDNVTINGALALTPGAANSVTLNGAATLPTGVGLNSNFGQVNITNAANATVYGKSGVNLGAITLAAGGNLIAISTTGNITNTGKLVVPGYVLVGAGSAVAPGDVNLNFTAAAGLGNAIAGPIFVQDDLDLLLGNSVPALSSTAIGNYLAKNLSVTNESATIVASITNSYGTGGISGNLSVTTTTAGNGITLAAAPVTGYGTIIGGAANLTSAGGITATAGPNTLPTINVNATSTSTPVVVAVNTTGNTTVNATLSGPAVNTSSATFTATTGNLTLGTVSSNYGGLVTFNARASGSIADTAVGGLQIYGPVKFDAKNDVKVNKGGDNFGGVTLDNNADDKTLELVEGGTLKIVSINNTGKKTTINLTSQNGSIIEDPTIFPILKQTNTGKTMTLSAVNGSVTLDRANNNNFAGQTNITVGSSGNVLISNPADTILGNINIPNGTLTVDVTNAGATNNKKISQASGTSLYTYGMLTLTSNGDGTAIPAGGGDITLSNSGNFLGAYAIKSGTGNITVTEETTINLQAIATAGNLTIKSVKGIIIDSTNASLPAGFTNSIVASGGVATFTANAAGGSITLGLANNSFISSVSSNTTGNASFANNTANALVLGASSVGGTLTAINNGSGQNISQNGVLNVTGDVTFTTTGGAASITLTNPNNAFGGVRFYAGTGGASFVEATTFNLKGGSVSTGPVTISTAGNFITTGPGGSSITSDLSISANGTIIPTANSLLVTGTFTVYSIGITDLSALSKSGNLANKSPVNSGPGAYTGPSL